MSSSRQYLTLLFTSNPVLDMAETVQEIDQLIVQCASLYSSVPTVRAGWYDADHIFK